MRKRTLALAALALISTSVAAGPAAGKHHLGIGIGLRQHSERYEGSSVGIVTDGTSAIAEIPCSQDPGCVIFSVKPRERYFQVSIVDRLDQSTGAIVAGENTTYRVCDQGAKFKINPGETQLEVRVVPTLCGSGHGVPTKGEIALTFARNPAVLGQTGSGHP